MTNDYVLTRWRKARRSGGREPAFTGVTGYLQLAEPGHGAEWALWSVSGFRPARNPRSVVATRWFGALIDSARKYPPALALAREDISRVGRPDWGWKTLSAAYEASLKRALRAQHAAQFVLAEAAVGEFGHCSAGEFYWVLRYLPGARRGDVGTVQWVSDDFHIYSNPASDFRLTPALLKRLRAQRRTSSKS